MNFEWLLEKKEQRDEDFSGCSGGDDEDNR